MLKLGDLEILELGEREGERDIDTEMLLDGL